MDLYEKLNLIDKIRHNSANLTSYLKKFSELKICYDIRSKGLLCGIELRKDGVPIKNIDKTPVGHFIAKESLKNGVYLRTLGNIVTIIPSLAMEKKDLKRLVETEYEIIQKLDQKIRRNR